MLSCKELTGCFIFGTCIVIFLAIFVQDDEIELFLQYIEYCKNIASKNNLLTHCDTVKKQFNKCVDLIISVEYSHIYKLMCGCINDEINNLCQYFSKCN